MATLAASLAEFISLLERGQSDEAIARFYDDEVVVFENRELARAGRERCLGYEREQLARQSGPVSFKVERFAVNEADGLAFLEVVIRFRGRDGRPMRLEEVAVQTWHRGKITKERFYYEGVVDEGDELGHDDAVGSG